MRIWAQDEARRNAAGPGDRNAPFHPDLFSLVSREWTIVQAFQRVRSTVQIFARTALHWVRNTEADRWVPDLIGVGDLPLQTDVLESVLSSGYWPETTEQSRVTGPWPQPTSSTLVVAAEPATTLTCASLTTAWTSVSLTRPFEWPPPASPTLSSTAPRASGEQRRPN